MAFDGRQEENRREEMASTLVQMADMTQEIVKLREAIAPLLERHHRQERKQILELERQNQKYLLEQSMLAQAYADCDCTPNRTAALAGQFSNWIDDQIARYKPT